MESLPRPFPLLLAIAATLWFAFPAPTVGQSRPPEPALAEVRQRIQALESRVRTQQAERDTTGAALRRVETEMAATQQRLDGLRRQQAEALEHRRMLAAEQAAAGARLEAERTALARQLRLSFMTGREALFKLLMSQEDPARLGRMLVYYDYFNRTRTERIRAVGAELETLSRLERESAATEQRLIDLEADTSGELEKLRAARAERRTVLAELEASLASADQEITRLRSEEERLTRLVEELKVALEDFPVTAEEPITALRGRLPWPVAGRIVANYGQRRGAALTWNGVLLDAEAGDPVRAIYHGRVAFADWLNGLGLLVIVDHGDGYMSLYGHNQALLKEPGDWVAPGEPLAEVGDSGGQPRPRLYFEMRRNGRPTDPRAWLAGAPRAP